MNPDPGRLAAQGAAPGALVPEAAGRGRHYHHATCCCHRPQYVSAPATGSDRKAWHTRLNEIQILLHTSPVNAAREARGLVPANSVWFWAAGGCRRLVPCAGAAVERRAAGTGSGAAGGVPSSPVPANGAELLAQPGGGEQLLVLGLLAPILSQADAEAWQAALERLAYDWLTRWWPQCMPGPWPNSGC